MAELLADKIREYLALILVTGLLLAVSPVAAEDWLPPGSSTDLKQNRPAELLKKNVESSRQFLYGRLLFRSPEILGEKAVRIGLSCDSCHTNGHVNTSFYIQGLSDEPGRIDVSHRFWQAGHEDGIANPIAIPSLRGVAETAPYGTVKTFPDLPAFTRHVTMTEFGGPELRPDQLAALVTYLKALDFGATETQTSNAKTSMDMSYLPLLEVPLYDRDRSRVIELLDLIRADIGRHLTSDNQANSQQLVEKLMAIKKEVADGRFDTAIGLYKQVRP